MKFIGVYLFFSICFVLMTNNDNMTNQNSKSIAITAWNMGCAYSTALPYINELMKKSDIICLSEHSLYPCELHKLKDINNDFDSLSKASRTLNDQNLNNIQGNGGCAILWHKKLANHIRPLPEVGSDRICVIELTTENRDKLYILSVYLPYQGCRIADFREEFEILRGIFDEYYHKGSFCIIGDWNCQFSQIYGARGSSSTYTNAKELFTILSQYNLDVIDIGPTGRGPLYTFHRGESKTYIDHCAISATISHLLVNVEIMQDHILNVSDHLPITCELNINYTCARYESTVQRVAWHRAPKEIIAELYTEPLDNDVYSMLNNYDLDPNAVLNGSMSIYNDVSQIDLQRFACELTDKMKLHSYSLPQVKFNKKLKPYWGETLAILNKTKKDAWRQWVNAGRPRDPENVINMAFKDAKRLFRAEQRRRQNEYEKKQMQSIVENQDIDQKYFWYLINRSKNRVHTVSPIQTDNGEMITDIDKIRLDWNNYYKNLYTTPNTEDDKYKEFMDMVNDKIQGENTILSKSKGSHLEDGPFILSEIESEISKMKNGKATGWDLISAEHLKFSGSLTKAILVWLNNAIIVNECIPQLYKRGLIVSIPKPGKVPIIKTNNRGITLLPTLYKLLERLILLREQEWLRDQNVIDVTQGAGQEKCSSMHTSMLLQETLSYNMSRGATVYVAFLDIKKAFDTVWVNGLLYKLLESGMRRKPWVVIKNSFQNYECAAFVGGQAAPWFTPERGVHQGAPLSMPLYQVYVNDLLKQLRESKFAVSAHGIKVGSPTFADDISAPALCKIGLNCLLQIAFAYGVKWQFEFSAVKSLVMRWGPELSPNVPITFGGKTMNIIDKTKHMGITLQTTKVRSDDIVNDRIKKAKCTLLAARGIGSKSVPVPPSVLSKLYWNVSLSSALYGMEVVPYSSFNVVELEHAHRQNAKIVQGLPSNVPRPSPLMPLGWISLQGYIDIRKIIFLLSIMSLPSQNIYRKIALRIVLECIASMQNGIMSPVACMYKCVAKYSLHGILKDFVTHSNGDLKSAKLKVKRAVWEWETTRWKCTMLMYPELRLYRECISGPQMHSWYIYLDKNPSMYLSVTAVMSILLGGQPKGIQCNFECIYCRLCANYRKESPTHVLFECPALQETRDSTWPGLLRSMPNAMSESIQSKNNDEKAKLLLSCYGGSYIPEWNHVYANTAKMVHLMYKQRHSMYTSDAIVSA